MTKKERLLIGKQIHDGEISVDQCMERHEVSRRTAYRFAREYAESKGLKKPKAPSKPLGVSAAAAGGYESMGKPELIRELMRRDIEVARLKKGYSVKGGGSKKEYVISSGSNTK